MATSKQEKTYNEIIEYYGYADKLIAEVENSKDELAKDQFELVEKMVESLEDCADELTSKYLEYVKTDNPKEISKASRDAFNQILARIEECRNRILMIHNKR
jgi:predicted transcriptional regulator